MAAAPTLGGLIGNALDDFVCFVSGSTPADLAAELPEKLARLEPAHVGKFVGACLVAATACRRVLDEYLGAAERLPVARFIKQEYVLNNNINFTALNLIGHCLMASDAEVGVAIVLAFRAKAGAKSIWHCNLRTAQFSETMKRIFQEKVGRITRDVAVAQGNLMNAAFIARAKCTYG